MSAYQTVRVTIGEPLYQVEKHFILATFEAYENNQAKTARVLKIDRNSLRSKLKAYGALK